jgi:hypothetical protein
LLYSPSFRGLKDFSEPGFPAYPVLGNSEGVRAKERARA